MAYCTKCGSKLADGAKFCTNCGSPIQQGASRVEQQAPQAPPHRDGIPPVHPSAGNYPPQRNQMWQNSGYQPQKSGSLSGVWNNVKGFVSKIVAMFTSLVALVGGGYWGYNQFFGSESSETSGGSSGKSFAYERILTDAELDEVFAAEKLPEVTEDRKLPFGSYSFMNDGMKTYIIFNPYDGDDPNIMANVSGKIEGHAARKAGFCCYCGRGLYAMFTSQKDYENRRHPGYFLVDEGGKTLTATDNAKHVTFTYEGSE